MPHEPQKSTNVRTQTLPLRLHAARAALGVLGRAAPPLAAGYAERLFTTARRHPRPAWESDALVAAEPLRIPHGASFLPAWSWGPVDGPVALLVHGWEGRGSQLSALSAPLVSAGYRVVAFDAPGHGDAASRRASLVDHARGICSAAAHVGRRGHVDLVVAHSMGGAASLLATRYGFRAGAFALVAPPTSPSTWVDGFEKALDLSRPTRDAMIRRIERRFGIVFDSLDARADIGRLGAPILVVHDQGDREVPVTEGRRIADAAERARYLETRGLGHRRILRAPEVLEAVHAFAIEHAPRSSSARGQSAPHAAASGFAETLDAELFFRESRWAS